ncbi:adaptor protein [Jeotgalibacillus malaysiensis]|uniref:Adapter protein MecA n=1 Tax=Jeotgalibacillus malaysiensis TaxID=1508404 RepID=A0A0B5AK52_9BACL|nr:adaptor protein MecA [Jeotgalibacillus malaysiensis]AJD90730.1 adaptor protein [Jeotgalibacillus malaysiensis]
MEIERINDHTVKFYISYGDIEDRGFDREEIWYNRDKSEELFWEMMDEVHQEEDFTVEGPLWIQVQALEKGLEILVTKAQVTKDGQKFELPMQDDKNGTGLSNQIEDYLDQHFDMEDEQQEELEMKLVMRFQDFEDVISLSKRFETEDRLTTKLFSYENHYFMYIEFPENQFEEDDFENISSLLYEYGKETNVTVHRLEEYGKVIMKDQVFKQIVEYFS